MDYERLKTEYLCFLMNKVQIPAAGPDGYYELCKILNRSDFIPIIPYDENLCDECRDLRHEFSEEDADILNCIIPYDGSMMELLVVLTDRICYETKCSPYDAEPQKWFLEMLENCGLKRKTNSSDYIELDTKKIVQRINMRFYGFSGEGGLFPLKLPKTDQRYTELIVQMNNYIEENYDFT